MKQIVLFVAVYCLILVYPATAESTEVFSDFSVGNLGFSRDRTPSDEDLPFGSYPWGIGLGIRHPAFETVDIELALRRDPVIGNTTDLLFTHRSGFVELSVGPFLGVYNTEEKSFLMLPGVYSGLRFNLGTVGFASVHARTPFYDGMSQEGDYRQATREYEMGFFVPNVILSIFYGEYTFDEITDLGLVGDEKTVSELRAHVYQKNAPYEIDLAFGYHDYRKRFVAADQAFGALILGTAVHANVTNRWRVFVGLQSALYAFGRKDLLGDESGSRYFFRASAGTRLQLNAD